MLGRTATVARVAAAGHRVDVLVAVALGGAIGAAARYGVAQAVDTTDGGFPLATFVVNVLGSLLLGLLSAVRLDAAGGSVGYVRPFFAVGMIGSFTTYSTFAVENVALVEQGDVAVAALYVPAMLVSGLAAAVAGSRAGRRLGRSVPA